MRRRPTLFWGILICLVLFIALGYLKWRSGRIVAEEEFGGVTVQVVDKPSLGGRSIAIPGTVGRRYEVRVLGRAGQLITAFRVSWGSHEFSTFQINQTDAPSTRYEVLFEDAYAVSCRINMGDMPWVQWETHAQSAASR